MGEAVLFVAGATGCQANTRACKAKARPNPPTHSKPAPAAYQVPHMVLLKPPPFALQASYNPPNFAFPVRTTLSLADPPPPLTPLLAVTLNPSRNAAATEEDRMQMF